MQWRWSSGNRVISRELPLSLWPLLTGRRFQLIWSLTFSLCMSPPLPTHKKRTNQRSQENNSRSDSSMLSPTLAHEANEVNLFIYTRRFIQFAWVEAVVVAVTVFLVTISESGDSRERIFLMQSEPKHRESATIICSWCVVHLATSLHPVSTVPFSVFGCASVFVWSLHECCVPIN